METVDVVVATFGNADLWSVLAKRAIHSAECQTVKPAGVWYAHDLEGTDLSNARNQAAEESSADWLIFLDADDELDSHYVESMLAGDGDLRWPSTLGVVDGVEDDFPVLLQPKRHILVGNHMVIGTMVRRQLFTDVGGFRAGLPVLEDWDLWVRCLIAGAVACPCPDAIYRVHVRKDSRNTNEQLHSQVYADIQNRYRGMI